LWWLQAFAACDGALLLCGQITLWYLRFLFVRRLLEEEEEEEEEEYRSKNKNGVPIPGTPFAISVPTNYRSP
jgi:hypothetical protein